MNTRILTPLRGGRRNGSQASVETVADDARAEMLKRRLLRLTLDLHDGPMQNLAVIGLSLGELQRRIVELVPPEHHDRINSSIAQIAEELGEVDQEIRALITALEAGATESLPLVEAIEAEVRDFTRISPDTQVDLMFDGNARAETDSQRIALQSVARAALSNVAKHSDAGRVAVRLHGTPEAVTLEIEDDGKGFAAVKAKKTNRFGVSGMKERVEMLGGKFQIDSRPGGPTIVKATLQTWRPPSPA